jgi:predicted GH43/DUF377 family glycosyl hydrolase
MHVSKLGVVLEPSDHPFESKGVFNPAVIRYKDELWMIYRAVSKDNVSSLGKCVLADPTHVLSRESVPLLIPTEASEKMGIEDPRIVFLGGVFYITFTAYDGVTARGALITTADFIAFERKGILTPQMTYEDFQHSLNLCDDLNPKYHRFGRLFHHRITPSMYLNMQLWDKDLVMFPRKINGQFAFLHRIYPDIQLFYCDSFGELNYAFWKAYSANLKKYIVLQGKYDFESSYIGAGCPPIETPHGWLIIYHAVKDSAEGYIYSAGVALVDIDDPTREIARLPEPLFFPDQDFECKGTTSHVVFPMSTYAENDQLYIYYGAADRVVAVASVSLNQLISNLLSTIE